MTDDSGWVNEEQGTTNVRVIGLLSQLALGAGNYTEERRSLFAGLTFDEYRRGVEGPPAGTGDRRTE